MKHYAPQVTMQSRRNCRRSSNTRVQRRNRDLWFQTRRKNL